MAVDPKKVDLPQVFHGLVAGIIDAAGVYPHQAVILRAGGKMEVMSLDLPAPEVIAMLVAKSRTADVVEVIYGFDRSTRPGQGTEFADCVAGAWYRRGIGWAPLIIDYQHKPRIIRPINWGNAWWIEGVTRELTAMGVTAIAGSPG